MINNKKGFTLIELLAVIVILAIVLVVSIPSVIRAMNNAKHNQFQNAADVTVDWLNKQHQMSKLGGTVGNINEDYVDFFNDYCDGNVGASYEEAKACNLFKYERKAIKLLEASGISEPEKNIDLTRSYIWKNGENYSIKLTALEGGDFYVKDGSSNYVISSINDRVSITISSLEENADSERIADILEEYTGTEVDEVIGFTIDNLDIKTSREIAKKVSKYGAVVSYSTDYSDDEYLESSEEVYYSNINTAIADANNGSTSNGEALSASSVASLQIANNTITISLLKNIDNVGVLDITRSMVLNLNGKTMNMVCDTTVKKGIIINAGVKLTINGSVVNSTLRYNNANNIASNLFNISGDLIVNGGKYELIGSGSQTNLFTHLTKGSSYNVTFNDCDIVIDSLNSYLISMNGENTGSKVNYNRCDISIDSDIPSIYNGKAKLGFEDCDIEINMMSTANAYLIINNTEMNIKNVNFEVNNSISNGVLKAFYNYGDMTINNLTLTLNNEQGTVYGILNNNNLTINNSEFDITSSGDTVSGIGNNKNLNVNNLNMEVNNSGGTIYSFANGNSNGVMEISGLNLYSAGSGPISSTKTVYGIYNGGGSSVTVRNSTIVSDSSSNNPGTTAEPVISSTGIYSNSGDLNLYNVNLTSNDRGIQMSQNGNLFISGGRYSAFGHGAIYFSNGLDGQNYIQDTELISENWANYNGKYSTDDWFNITSCMYIGGGSNANNSNINVYIDNSVIYDKNSKDGYFVLRGGGAGEHDSSLYISNTTFRYDTSEKMRIDNDTHNLYLGSGNNINEAWQAKLPRIKGVSDGTVHFTNDVYRRQ